MYVVHQEWFISSSPNTTITKGGVGGGGGGGGGGVRVHALTLSFVSIIVHYYWRPSHHLPECKWFPVPGSIITTAPCSATPTQHYMLSYTIGSVILLAVTIIMHVVGTMYNTYLHILLRLDEHCDTGVEFGLFESD